MSCSLIWTRKVKQDINGKLETLLKSKFTTPYTLDRTDISYLQGLYDAGFEDANKLIEAIEKYDEITLDLEC